MSSEGNKVRCLEGWFGGKGVLILIVWSAEDFIKGFQVFDRDGNGFIGQGELKYVLTSLGEKLSDEEVDELLKGVPITAYVVLFLSGFSF